MLKVIKHNYKLNVVFLVHECFFKKKKKHCIQKLLVALCSVLRVTDTSENLKFSFSET